MIGRMILLTLLAFATITNAFYVIVPTGNVGVQTYLGVIQQDVLLPGLHFHNPFTRIEIVDVNSQTDTVSVIKCKINH